MQKKPQKLADWQQDRNANKGKSKDNPEIEPVTCHVCGKVVKGAYGWTDLVTEVVASCYGKCEREIATLRSKRHDFIFHESGTPVRNF